ncbi:MAG: DUF190 domain-containing protein [bacterium]
MQPDTEAKLLRIFIGEGDRHQHSCLHEVIVKMCREAGLAGATVLRGLMSYGSSSHFRSTRILDLSADLPVVVEIVDTEARINAILPAIDQLLDQAECGGLVTLETVRIIKYRRGRP